MSILNEIIAALLLLKQLIVDSVFYKKEWKRKETVFFSFIYIIFCAVWWEVRGHPIKIMELNDVIAKAHVAPN